MVSEAAVMAELGAMIVTCEWMKKQAQSMDGQSLLLQYCWLKLQQRSAAIGPILGQHLALLRKLHCKEKWHDY